MLVSRRRSLCRARLVRLDAVLQAVSAREISIADARSASSWDLVQSALGNNTSADAHANTTIIEELLAKRAVPPAKSTARAKAAEAGDQVREFSVKMTKRARHDDADAPPAPEPSAEEAEDVVEETTAEAGEADSGSETAGEEDGERKETA